jgi:pyruvate dehydrogenase E2 component (dihydrolipoamide acetyltransferase)
MVEEVRLPEISENVESGEVIEVLVKVGDFIEAEQSLVELETEKAAFEVPSPFSGKIVEINVKEGDQIKVGQTIVKVDTQAKAEEEKGGQPAKQETEEEQQRKEKPAEKQRSQQPEEKAAEKKEAVEKPQRQEDLVRESEAIAEVEEARQKAKPARSVPAAPSVRQLARELGIEISEVAGSGPAGRISADDVKKYAKSIIIGAPVSRPAKGSRALPDFTKWGAVERNAMTATRKKIADTLSYTWSNVPQVSQYDHADITMLEEFRRQYSEKVEQAGGKLTITSILVKVVASALKEFPIVNASVDAERQEIIYKKYFNIAVAVDTDRGLLVPVIRDADQKSILELSVELTELAQKTREHKISPEDMVGGNFTISNLGGIGGTNFAPIIYWPQVAILGVARASRRPVYTDAGLEPRLILPVSLSYDHRIIDGVEGLRFLRWIVRALERPFSLAMQEAGG